MYRCRLHGNPRAHRPRRSLRIEPYLRQPVRVAGLADVLSASGLGVLGGKEEAKSAVAYLLAISR